MKIAISSENGGFELKHNIIDYFSSQEITFVDAGTYSKDSCNYAEFALKAAKLVARKEVDLAIVICNTGEGVTIMANKVKGVKCALLYNDIVAEEAKSHNNANCISFAARFTSSEDAIKRIKIFLNTRFIGEPHASRLKTIENYDENRDI